MVKTRDSLQRVDLRHAAPLYDCRYRIDCSSRQPGWNRVFTGMTFAGSGWCLWMVQGMRETLFFLLAAAAFGQQPALRLNEIQIIGSHNSYHAGLAANEMTYLRGVNPKAADALDYRHPSLQTQLDAGVRQLEI